MKENHDEVSLNRTFRDALQREPSECNYSQRFLFIQFMIYIYIYIIQQLINFSNQNYPQQFQYINKQPQHAETVTTTNESLVPS